VLDPLFAPASVAILGASAEGAKWGNLLAAGALAGEHRRRVFLVSRRGGEILGRQAFDSLGALPSPPELVVVSVPAHEFEAAVDAALAAGARAIVGITAGLGEAGGEAQTREAAVAARVRAAGALLLGPNCLGVFDRAAELYLAPWIDFPPGEIGLIAQSGNLALELGLLARREGVGFSRFASVGNQADVNATELLADLAAHEPTRLIALYVEDFRDGRAFVRGAQAAVAGGKPVVLLAAGASEASARAARSHTGALVSDLAAVDAACRTAGVVRVTTPKQLVDAAKALLRGRGLRGRRIAVFGDGGGHGVVAADVASAHGLELPVLSDGLAAALAAILPGAATTRNPVDLAGAGESDLTCFERVGRLLLDSGEVDALLLTGYFGGYGGWSAESGGREVDVARALAGAAATRGRALVVHTLFPDSAAAGALRAGGALVYPEIERAARALAVLAARPEKLDALPELPDPEPTPADDGYFTARALVAEAGIPLPDARPVRTIEDVRAAAAALGYPLVLKSLAREHKSDSGGVVLNIGDLAELERAYGSLADRFGPECSLERMEATEGGFELVVGVRRDARFGPVLVVGAGGVATEHLQDAVVALAPVTRDAAEGLVRSLRCGPVLEGARGRQPLDVRAAAQAAVALSRRAAASPGIQVLETNPLLVKPRGAIALDARVVLADARLISSMEEDR
jgi:acetate---CoA ligase (ADP-forming)